MKRNPLIQLQKFGQSIWLDDTGSGSIKSGELKKAVDSDVVKGVILNRETILNVLKESNDYDEVLKSLFVMSNLSDKDVFLQLATNDAINAAESLMPVYEASGGTDGFVCIGTDPAFLHDTEHTIREAKELFNGIGKKNIMLNIYATLEGLHVFRQLIAEGYNVCCSNIYSIKRYEDVIHAYMEGLEERVRERKEIEGIVSAAGFCVSPLDYSTDELLRDRYNVSNHPDEKAWIKELMGRFAVANAKTAYQATVTHFSSDRFLELKAKGAKIQRILWSDMTMQNVTYSSIYYAEKLIGPNTIAALTEELLLSFKEQGAVERSVNRDLEEALSVLESLADININTDTLANDLETNGVKRLSNIYNSALETIAEKRKAFESSQ